MKKVLVLGGNGFIGSNLVAFIAEKGYEVYSFDMRLPQKKLSSVHYLEGDFFDDCTLRKIVKGMDYIYHAICTMNPGNSNEKYVVGYERDFIQSIKLLDMIKDTDTRLIFLSSGGTVYGNQAVQPIKEDSLPLPINHYGNLKLCIENTIRTANYQMKKNMIIARISNPYGPGQDYKKGVGFIDAVIKNAIEKHPIQVWGDGSVVRDYIYITDVCEMLFAIMEYSGEHDVFNLSSGKGYSQKQILEEVEKIAGELSVSYTEKRQVDASKIILDNQRIKDILHHQITSLEDGLRMYFNYVKDSYTE